MKSKRPILYVLGVPGHFYLAKALSKEFDLPVVGITNYGRIEAQMTDDMEKMVGDVRSFPSYYLGRSKELENETIDAISEKFEKIAQELGIENNNMLVHSDRALRWNKDYKKSIIFQLATAEFVKIER